MIPLNEKNQIISTSPFFFFALAIFWGAIACSDNSNGPEDTEPLSTGSYPLVQVEAISNLNGGGSGIPVTFTDGGGNELIFHEGSLELLASSTYDLSVVIQLNSLNTPISYEGTYTQNGGTLDFEDDADPENSFSAFIDDWRLVAQHNSIAGVSFRLTFDTREINN